MDLTKTTKRFIDTHWNRKQPLLLGYSGGPDSKALLYALLDAGVHSLHLAHIDHGWRQESRDEAETIRREAARLGLPCHMRRLRLESSANLEASGREERLRFFTELCAQFPFQAVLLAHHSGDLAETVLKRILEGAALYRWAGFTEISAFDSLVIWRPWLKINKGQILAYLAQRGLPFIDDCSNRDRRFLRARMRAEIVPALQKSFGKEVVSNLVYISDSAAQLHRYLDRNVRRLREEKREGPWGVYWDAEEWDPLEARYFFQQWDCYSRAELDTAVHALQQGAAHRSFGPLVVDRKKIFAFQNPLPAFGSPVLLREGQFQSGDWILEITPHKETEIRLPDWRELWSGAARASLPEGTIALNLNSSTTAKRYSNAKIPQPLRLRVPTINGEVELLTGRVKKPFAARWDVRISVRATNCLSSVCGTENGGKRTI